MGRSVGKSFFFFLFCFLQLLDESLDEGLTSQPNGRASVLLSFFVLLSLQNPAFSSPSISNLYILCCFNIKEQMDPEIFAVSRHFYVES